MMKQDFYDIFWHVPATTVSTYDCAVHRTAPHRTPACYLAVLPAHVYDETRFLRHFLACAGNKERRGLA